MKRFIGILSLLLGMVGIIMPIMPGWIFIFLGLSLMSSPSRANSYR